MKYGGAGIGVAGRGMGEGSGKEGGDGEDLLLGFRALLDVLLEH